ncbi:MAG: four helix bundle protein [Acidobacteria bacterium]|nr:MAG: four helix bundle protein [Acidobacteriota bacterium]
MKSHKDLDVWKKAVLMSARMYKILEDFPIEERYGLSSQMKRASVSVASNIAEGAARQSGKEFVHFLFIALGSASELDTQIEISKLIFRKENFMEELDGIQQETRDISKMIYGLINSVKRGYDV